MTAITSQTYLKTRVTVMAKQLYSPGQFEDLIHSPLEALGKNFSLVGLIEQGLSPATLNRVAEKALIRTLMQELSVLLRPLERPARSILVDWIRKFELYNLKAIIRGKLKELPFDQIRENLHDLPPLISLPHERLLRTENILELLRLLEEGPYSDIAHQARRVYEEKNEPFSLDAAIDHSYYTGLLRRASAAEPEDRSPLLRLLGAMIDQQNLIWLLRYRFSYGLSATETYFLLIPFGRRLFRDHLKLLVNEDSFEGVIEGLRGHFKDVMSDVGNALEAERILDNETAAQAHQSLRFSPSAVTRSLAYLVLREMDLKRIYAVIQGKVLKLDDSLIRTAAGMPVVPGEETQARVAGHV